jgi:hypothetical protein
MTAAFQTRGVARMQAEMIAILCRFYAVIVVRFYAVISGNRRITGDLNAVITPVYKNVHNG